MRTLKLSGVCLLCTCLVLVHGCASELRDLRIQNDTQRKRIAELESQVNTANLQLDQMRRQLAAAGEKGGIEQDALEQKIAALEEDLAKKKELIASMQEKLLYSGGPLPVELTTKLEDFAKAHEMVTYDASRGIVKFKSDLLFEKGSDRVAASAVEAVKSLCEILNSEEAKKFDVIVAGHTDDIPIQKPATREKHPTNWHLSAHRAISVLDIMKDNNIDPKRTSIRGFGEYRPIVDNRPGKKGNPQNRRVEIYIVPEGT
jgi:chemotaxis protein MotB